MLARRADAVLNRFITVNGDESSLVPSIVLHRCFFAFILLTRQFCCEKSRLITIQVIFCRLMYLLLKDKSCIRTLTTFHSCGHKAISLHSTKGEKRKNSVLPLLAMSFLYASSAVKLFYLTSCISLWN